VAHGRRWRDVGRARSPTWPTDDIPPEGPAPANPADGAQRMAAAQTALERPFILFDTTGRMISANAIAHSVLIYVIGPEGRFVIQFSNATDPDNMARTLSALINQRTILNKSPGAPYIGGELIPPIFGESAYHPDMSIQKL
jgi:hypothetical protein